MIEWILASNSPRRKELLALFGNSFTILPADINEARLPGEPSVDYVNRLACEKAKAVAALNDGLIIAADTIVADGEQLLGKPGDENEARENALPTAGQDLPGLYWHCPDRYQKS